MKRSSRTANSSTCHSTNRSHASEVSMCEPPSRRRNPSRAGSRLPGDHVVPEARPRPALSHGQVDHPQHPGTSLDHGVVQRCSCAACRPVRANPTSSRITHPCNPCEPAVLHLGSRRRRSEIRMTGRGKMKEIGRGRCQLAVIIDIGLPSGLLSHTTPPHAQQDDSGGQATVRKSHERWEPQRDKRKREGQERLGHEGWEPERLTDQRSSAGEPSIRTP